MRVFLTSPWIPAEWIRAHRLEPRGVWFDEGFRREMPALAAGVCAVAESAVRFAEAQPDAAIIFTTACDQLRRAFDAVTFGRQPRAFLFNLPATQSPAARTMHRAEMQRLGGFLGELGGRMPSSPTLRTELLRADESRRRLSEVAPLAAARAFAEAVRLFFDQGKLSLPPLVPARNQVPLALIGGPVGVADGRLFDAVEAAGGGIVLNATKTGERAVEPFFKNEGDPFDALVSGCFDTITDVFQRPNTRLYAWLRPRLQARQVRGIVVWHFTGCDLWRAEAASLREAFGLPVLLLEAGEPHAWPARNQTRLDAFVETLQ